MNAKTSNWKKKFYSLSSDSLHVDANKQFFSIFLIIESIIFEIEIFSCSDYAENSDDKIITIIIFLRDSALNFLA